MKAVALGLLALFCVVGLVFGQYPGYGYRQEGGGGGGFLWLIGLLVIIVVIFGAGNRQRERGTTIIRGNLSSTG